MNQYLCNTVSKDPSSSECSVCPQAAKFIFFIFSGKPISFKGLSREVNIFVKRPIKDESVLMSMHCWFLKLLGCLVEKENKCNEFACFYENRC
jgi:hypothetical protein